MSVPERNFKKDWNIKCVKPFKTAGVGSFWRFDKLVEKGQVMRLIPKNMTASPILIQRNRFYLFFKFVYWRDKE